jgi:hypothetical protein
MATSSGRSVGRPPHLHNQIQDYEPGDEIIGGWPLDRLLHMDNRFVERLKHAIARGLEKRPQGTEMPSDDKVCARCGRPFHPTRSNAAYCSRGCYNARCR